MWYRKEFDVRTFGFWSGALEWFKEFERLDMLDELQRAVEDAFADDADAPTATDVNDFVWFDDDLHEAVDAAERKRAKNGKRGGER